MRIERVASASPRARARPSIRTVAIMQPYFVPYAGYFRLFAAADLFVILDTVQFPRRGWVHRNRLLDDLGRPQWITLPLSRVSRNATIQELRFSPDGDERLRESARRFPALRLFDPAPWPEDPRLFDLEGRFVDHAERMLRCTCALLDLPFRAQRASDLDVDPSLRGQERILAIAAEVGAREYLNPPGGSSLYHPRAFRCRGIHLRFLPQWNGGLLSILQVLHTGGPGAVEEIRKAIRATS